MEGEKKKRKMEEAEEAEQEEVEKFFALIKSTREVRERLQVSGAAPENKEKTAADTPPWNPKFVLEDFVEALPPQLPPAEVEKAPASSGSMEEREKQESGEKSGNNKGLMDLDLNLSL